MKFHQITVTQLPYTTNPTVIQKWSQKFSHFISLWFSVSLLVRFLKVYKKLQTLVFKFPNRKIDNFEASNRYSCPDFQSWRNWTDSCLWFPLNNIRDSLFETCDITVNGTVRIPVCLPVYPFDCLSVCLSAFACVSVCLPVSLIRKNTLMFHVTFINQWNFAF